VPLVPLGDHPDEARWTVTHDGHGYLVLRHEDGYVVTDALCPHKQLPLAEGLVRDGALVCPGHWYAFDLADGRCRTTGEVSLPVYPVHDGAFEVPERTAPLSWSERLRAHARDAG
jgi:nitrite reductase (NADH) small subunit